MQSHFPPVQPCHPPGPNVIVNLSLVCLLSNLFPPHCKPTREGPLLSAAYSNPEPGTWQTTKLGFYVTRVPCYLWPKLSVTFGDGCFLKLINAKFLNSLINLEALFRFQWEIKEQETNFSLFSFILFSAALRSSLLTSTPHVKSGIWMVTGVYA